jgi:hypothetical protein
MQGMARNGFRERLMSLQKLERRFTEGLRSDGVGVVREGCLHLVSAKSRSAEARQFAALLKIESRLELTASDQPKAGFEPNWFGGHDRADLRRDLLDGYATLVGVFPNESGLRYRYAGALARAMRCDEARAIYSDLVDGEPSIQLMLAMVELALGDRASAERTIANYNAYCLEQGTPFLCSTIEKISLPRREAP